MSKQNRDDDSMLESYTYVWSPESTLALEEFLGKYRPSMVQDDGNKPWIWVKGSKSAKEEPEHDAAVEEATEMLKEITEKVEKIKNDASIPTRSNKKTGAISKKELREQVQAEATERLKAISVKHGVVSGKWLIFAPADKVDQIWTKLAISLVSGPLAATPAYRAKVATSPRSETPNHQHVICLYMPDVYDEQAVKEVMKVLLRNHGLNLSGVKSNLYTAVGIDSKHPSGIQSTVWKNTSLMKDSEIKQLKDAFFAEIDSSKPSGEEKAQDEKSKESAPAKEKPKFKAKKKAAEDNIFVSDDEGDGAAPAPAKMAPTKSRKPAPKFKASVKAARDDPFASTDEDDDEAKPSAKPDAKGKKRAGRSNVSKKESPESASNGSDDEAGERPTKKRKNGGK